MNKKLIIGCVGIIFLFATMSIVSAINTNQVKEKKESPLFGLRTNGAISEKMGEIKEKIKTNYIERLFLQIQKTSYDNINVRGGLDLKGTWGATNACPTCQCMINQAQEPRPSVILICTYDFTVPMCTCGLKHCWYPD